VGRGVRMARKVSRASSPKTTSTPWLLR
jgi:hypothetical protein